MIRLVPLRAEDLDRLAPLWLDLHAHHRRVAPELAPFVADSPSWQSRRQLYAEVTAGYWFGFLAIDGADDVGYLICAERPMPWNATFDVPASLWELVTIVVRGDRRGRGIGTRLLAAMEERIALSGTKSRLIGVIPSNRAAVTLYRSRGYRPTWLTLTRFQRLPATPSGTHAVSIRPMPPGEVERLEPLWLALHHHHQAVSPELGPFVADGASWPIIRGLLAENAEDGLLFCAFEGDRIAGLVSAAVYGVSALSSFSDTWKTDARVAEIKFLSVAPKARGHGIGAALTQAVDRALSARGVSDSFVGAIAPNDGAIRFYLAQGYRPAWLELTRF